MHSIIFKLEPGCTGHRWTISDKRAEDVKQTFHFNKAPLGADKGSSPYNYQQTKTTKTLSHPDPKLRLYRHLFYNPNGPKLEN